MHTFTIKMLLLVTMIVSVLIFVVESSSKKCKYTRSSHQLFKVDCIKVDLDIIPQNLQEGIEVMDFRYNQLGRLPNDSLSHYTYLQEAYFQKNGMAVIEESAFEPTQHLQILDLSCNQLKELPTNIFKLPELRKLYLHNNPLTDKIFDSVEVTAPIERLDLSYNKLTQFPKFKHLVNVKTLNLTGNGITKLSVDDLAPLCSLEVLYVNKNPITFNNDACKCVEIDKWFDKRNIKLDISLNENVNCPKSLNCTSSVLNSTLHDTKFNDCKSIMYERLEARQSYIAKIWISVIIGIVIVLGCIGGYLMYRRSTRRCKSRSTQTISPPNITTAT